VAVSSKKAVEAPSQVVASITNLTKLYGDRVVLDDISLEFEAGKLVALLGRSGSGKTTILRILSGLEQPTAGSARLDTSSSVVFQEPRLIPNMRVWRNVVLGLRGRERKASAIRLLEEVGLGAFVNTWPGLPSGGEAQRVGVARALSREPGFLLLDEPFASLDALTRRDMQALTLRLRAEHGFGALLVTHDIEEALNMADRILVLRGGSIVFDEVLAEPFPRRASDPRLSELRDRLPTLLDVDMSSYAAADNSQ
jgi:sulfonate transport system ATP-binding protein